MDERRWAWPFMIGRGRRTGYRTLLCPEILVRDHAYGVLERKTEPNMGRGRPMETRLRTQDGRALTVVQVSRRVTPADLPDTADLYDTHGRPLVVIYGLVFEGTLSVTPANTDLERARQAAMAAFADFLADEDGSELAVGRSFVADSEVREEPPELAAAPPPVEAGPPIRSSFFLTRMPLVGPVLVGVLAVGVAIVVLLALDSGPSFTRPPPSPKRTTQGNATPGSRCNSVSGGNGIESVTVCIRREAGSIKGLFTLDSNPNNGCRVNFSIIEVGSQVSFHDPSRICPRKGRGRTILLPGKPVSGATYVAVVKGGERNQSWTVESPPIRFTH